MLPNVYADPRVFDLAGAVEKLPAMLPMESEAVQVTGTDCNSLPAGRSESASGPSPLSPQMATGPRRIRALTAELYDKMTSRTGFISRRDQQVTALGQGKSDIALSALEAGVTIP